MTATPPPHPSTARGASTLAGTIADAIASSRHGHHSGHRYSPAELPDTPAAGTIDRAPRSGHPTPGAGGREPAQPGPHPARTPAAPSIHSDRARKLPAGGGEGRASGIPAADIQALAHRVVETLNAASAPIRVRDLGHRVRMHFPDQPVPTPQHMVRARRLLLAEERSIEYCDDRQRNRPRMVWLPGKKWTVRERDITAAAETATIAVLGYMNDDIHLDTTRALAAVFRHHGATITDDLAAIPDTPGRGVL